MYATLISFRTWWRGVGIANLSELLGCGWPACTPYNEVQPCGPSTLLLKNDKWACHIKIESVGQRHDPGP